jgi:hypothetical protein
VGAADNTPDGERGVKWWLSHVVVPLAAAAIVAGATLCAIFCGGGSGPRGTIASPTDGSTVPRTFTATGTLAGIDSQSHVWLVVQSNGLLFPKAPELEVQQSWIMQSIETGVPAGGRFSLILFMVGEEGQRRINAWLAHGEATGTYPGLNRIPDGEKLDTVTELIPGE